MKILNILKKILYFFKSLILNGLFTILPIAATVFFVQFIYKTLYSSMLPIHKTLPEFLQKIPGVEIILVFAFLFLIGMLLKIFVMESFIGFFENIIKKIPIVRTIYSSFKTFFDVFNIKDPEKEHKKKVVLIQFPSKNYYSLAFIWGPAENDFQKLIPHNQRIANEKYFRVFMPGSPNPTTGYFLVLPESEIINANITFEEAIKTIVSCGVITPETLKHLKKK